MIKVTKRKKEELLSNLEGQIYTIEYFIKEWEKKSSQDWRSFENVLLADHYRRRFVLIRTKAYAETLQIDESSEFNNSITIQDLILEINHTPINEIFLP